MEDYIFIIKRLYILKLYIKNILEIVYNNNYLEYI